MVWITFWCTSFVFNTFKKYEKGQTEGMFIGIIYIGYVYDTYKHQLVCLILRVLRDL